MAYLIANSSVPPDLDIAHKCANSLCVRPDHLWARTRKQNMENKQTRRRLSESKRGNKNRKVLTDKQIRRVKEIVRDRPLTTDAAMVEQLQLPVGAAAIARIRKGQTGTHVVVEGFVPRTHKTGYATESIKKQVYDMHDAGMTQKQIAQELGRSQPGIQKILKYRPIDGA